MSLPLERLLTVFDGQPSTKNIFIEGYPYFFSPIISTIAEYAVFELQSNSDVPLSLELHECLLDSISFDIYPILNQFLQIDYRAYQLSSALMPQVYKDFFDYFFKGGFKAFVDRYPDIYELVFKKIIFFIDNNRDLLKRVERHQSELCTFGKLIEISSSQGDTHNQGQSVRILRFSSGRKWVYKPRSLAIESGYFKFVNAINQRFGTQLATLKVLNFDDYGFVEHCDNSPLSSTKEIEQYYRSFGELAFIMLLLNAQDLHHENILCHKGLPIPIDLEMLFSSSIALDGGRDFDEALLNEHNLCLGTTALLGTWIADDSGTFFDISGISGKGVKGGTHTTMLMKGGKPHFKEVSLEPKGSDNFPQVVESLAPPTPNSHVDTIIKGFCNSYHRCLGYNSDNKEILAKIIEECWTEETKNRVLFRYTESYSQIVRASRAPKYKNTRRADFIYNELSGQYQPHKHEFLSQFEDVFESEADAINDHDIPYFSSTIHDVKIYDHRMKLINLSLNGSGFSLVMDNISKLNHDHIKRQANFIRTALCDRNSVIPLKNGYMLPVVEKGEFITSVLDGIKDCIWNQDRGKNVHNKLDYYCHYYIASSAASEMRKMTIGLYEGILGINIFLELINIHHTALCSNFREQFLSTIDEELKSRTFGIGLYHGTGGIIQGLVILFSITKDERYLELAITSFEQSNKSWKIRPNNLDLIEGLAMYLIGLNYLSQHFKSKELKMEIEEVHVHLSEKLSQISKKGVKNTSLSHGIGGIIYALTSTNISQIKGQLINSSLSTQLIDEFFDEACDDNSWCRGETGRLIIRLCLGCKPKLSELNRLFENTLEQINNSTNDNLCCGVLGQLNFLLSMNGVNGFEFDKSQVISSLKSRKELSKIRLGLNSALNSAFNPSLYTGLSGWGYFLLRFEYDIDDLLMPTEWPWNC